MRNERYEKTVEMVQSALATRRARGTVVEPAGTIGYELGMEDHPEGQRATWLRDLATGIKGCTECPLGPMRFERLRREPARWMQIQGMRPGQAVPGTGPINATVFALGDRPGRDEDATGEPIVGRTSQVFNQILWYLGLDRDRDVYVTNSVKCMPPDVREPTKTEWCRCSSLWLHRQIRMVMPAVIMVFGNVAFDALMQTRSMPNADPKDCRTEYTSSKTFDDLYGNRLLDYPLDPRIKVWWTRHYAALARDGRLRVRYTEQLEPLKEAIRKFREGT